MHLDFNQNATIHFELSPPQMTFFRRLTNMTILTKIFFDLTLHVSEVLKALLVARERAYVEAKYE